MSDVIQAIFQNKSADPSKLLLFGFEQRDSRYVYRRTLSDSGFVLTVSITAAGEIATEVIDPAFHEPYTLHLADGAAGSFVGKVKSQYEQALLEIAAKCFEAHVFRSKQAEDLIAYARSTYGDELEFLWQKFPDNAVWRRQDTKKWYGALLTVSRRKLGAASDEKVEIIDLRIRPEDLEGLIDGKHYFPGYHMNKKHWYTIILDDSIPLEEICRRIDGSYLLAVQ